MPKQNRVTPAGEIIAVAARGDFMGNRGGALHNDRQEVRLAYSGPRWLICELEFNNRHRVVMSPGHYTELFFLDEATALAAGHRPCFECRQRACSEFAGYWAAGNLDLVRQGHSLLETMDRALHRERIKPGRRKLLPGHQNKLTYVTTLTDLPNYAFIMLPGDETYYLILGDKLYPWQAEGYGLPLERPAEVEVEVLTPRSTVNALREGYQPRLHKSIQIR